MQRSVGSYKYVTTLSRSFLLQCNAGTRVSATLMFGGRLNTGPSNKNLLTFLVMPYRPRSATAASWAVYRSVLDDFLTIEPPLEGRLHQLTYCPVIASPATGHWGTCYRSVKYFFHNDFSKFMLNLILIVVGQKTAEISYFRAVSTWSKVKVLEIYLHNV